MVSASESADRLDQHLTFVDAAAAAGVRQIVYTSFVNAAPDAIFTLVRDHYATEQRIVDSGMAYTFLRDNFYLDFMEPFAGEQTASSPGRRTTAGWAWWRAPTWPGPRRPCCSTRSRTPESTYTLTGPEALTLTEAARASLTAPAAGRSGSTTRRSRRRTRRGPRYSAPDWQVEAWVTHLHRDRGR